MRLPGIFSAFGNIALSPDMIDLTLDQMIHKYDPDMGIDVEGIGECLLNGERDICRADQTVSGDGKTVLVQFHNEEMRVSFLITVLRKTQLDGLPRRDFMMARLWNVP